MSVLPAYTPLTAALDAVDARVAAATLDPTEEKLAAAAEKLVEAEALASASLLQDHRAMAGRAGEMMAKADATQLLLKLRSGVLPGGSLDAALSQIEGHAAVMRQLRDQAEAAAARAEVFGEAGALDAIFLTRAEADAALPSLAEGDIVEVVADETAGGGRWRYTVSGGAFANGVGLPVLDGVARVKGSGGGLDVTMRGAVLGSVSASQADANRALFLESVDRVGDGGEVYLPPGVLYVTPSAANGVGDVGIDVPSRVRIYGPGEIRYAPTVDAFDYVLNLQADGSRLEGVTVSAAGASFDVAGGDRGEVVRVDGDRVSLRGVTARGTGQAGGSANAFYLRGAYADLESCAAFDAGYAGFRLCVSPYGRVAGFRSYDHVSRVGVVSGQGVVQPTVTASASSGQGYLDVSREMQVGDILGVGLTIDKNTDVLSTDARLYRALTVTDLGGGEWRVALARAYHPTIDAAFFSDFPLTATTLDRAVSAGTRISYVEGTADISDVFGRSDASASVAGSGGIVVDTEPVILRRLNLTNYTLDATFVAVGLKVDFCDTAVLTGLDVAGRPNGSAPWYAMSTGGVYERRLVIKDSRFFGGAYVSRSLRHLSVEDTVFDVRGLGALRGDYALGVGAERADIRRSFFYGGNDQSIELRNPDSGTQHVRLVDVEHEGVSSAVPLVKMRGGEGTVTAGRVTAIRPRHARGKLAATDAEAALVDDGSQAEVSPVYDTGSLGLCAASDGSATQVAGVDLMASSGTTTPQKSLSSVTYDAAGVDLIASRALVVRVDTSEVKRFRVECDFGATAGRVTVQALGSGDAVLDPATADPADVVGTERDLIAITTFGGLYRDGNDQSGYAVLTFEVTDRTEAVLVGASKSGAAACKVHRVRVFAVGADGPVAVGPASYTPVATGLAERSTAPTTAGYEGQVVLDDTETVAGWRYDGSAWVAVADLPASLTTGVWGDAGRLLNQGQFGPAERVASAVADATALTAPADISATYTEAEVQALRDDLAALRTTVNAALASERAAGLRAT